MTEEINTTKMVCGYYFNSKSNKPIKERIVINNMKIMSRYKLNENSMLLKGITEVDNKEFNFAFKKSCFNLDFDFYEGAVIKKLEGDILKDYYLDGFIEVYNVVP